jgi:hypothetical protein
MGAQTQGPANLPQQRPFAQGIGPGGQYGAGQGQQGFAPSANPGIGAQISPAGFNGPDAPTDDQQPVDTSIWGRIKESFSNNPRNGGVPFSQRLGNIGAILSAASDPQGRSLAPTLNAVNDRFAEQQNFADQKAAYYAEQEKQQTMAKRLYENLKGTNPQMAEMILANPSLVKNYMEGQLDIDKTKAQEEIRVSGQKEVQTQQDQAAMDRLEYQTENDPTTIREREKIAAEDKRWNDFLDRNGLSEGASTLEIYSKRYKDPNMTANEAERIAGERIRNGEEGMNTEYRSVIDDRTKQKEVSLAENAAKQAGIDIPQGMRLVNPEDVFNKGKAPILEWMQGTKQWEAAQASKRNSQKAANHIVAAVDRIQGKLKQQAAGDVLTGAGWTGMLAEFPGETTAGEIHQDLNVINSNMGFQTIQENRSATTGGFLGQVSNWENILTQSTTESLNQSRDPQFFSDQLSRIRKVYAGVMTQSSTDPYKSVLQADAEALMAEPTPDAIAEFNDLWGDGAAEKIIEMGPAGAEPYAGQ